MKKYPVFISLLLSLLTACNSADNKDSTATVDSLKKDSQKEAMDTIPKDDFSDDTLYQISFSDTAELEIRSRIKGKGPNLVYHFVTTKRSRIIGTIIPRKEDCNIRFNNIILPGNKMDGPFGREIKYELPRKGDHQLVIGQNLMAGDARSCEFVLKLKLE